MGVFVWYTYQACIQNQQTVNMWWPTKVGDNNSHNKSNDASLKCRNHTNPRHISYLEPFICRLFLSTFNTTCYLTAMSSSSSFVSIFVCIHRLHLHTLIDTYKSTHAHAHKNIILLKSNFFSMLQLIVIAHHGFFFARYCFLFIVVASFFLFQCELFSMCNVEKKKFYWIIIARSFWD